MKALLAICLFLISTPATTSAQDRSKHHASLTRAQTKEAEQKLADLGYWTGHIEGLTDRATRSALIAFQKWEGRVVSGKLTVEELEAIRNSTSPKPRDLGYAHVEVDLDRQILMIVDDEGDVRVLPVSTGSGKQFEYEGQTSIAYTPAAGSSFMRKVLAGKTMCPDRCTTLITSAAALLFMAAIAFPCNRRVMVAFAYLCSPLVR